MLADVGLWMFHETESGSQKGVSRGPGHVAARRIQPRLRGELFVDIHIRVEAQTLYESILRILSESFEALLRFEWPMLGP